MTPTQLKKQFRKMSTRAALMVMVQRGFAGKYFSRGDAHYTPDEALINWPKIMLESPCSLYSIKFFGGPPDKGRWYRGTVLSMLCDIILFDWATKGVPTGEQLAL